MRTLFTRENHGESKNRTKEYTCWASMVKRCEAPASYTSEQRYKARGVQVCERWRKSYLAFLEDMGRAPSQKHSIDRINNDGNYEPGNCQWATQLEQAGNRSNSLAYDLCGRRFTVTDLASLSGMKRDSLYQALRRGGDPRLILLRRTLPDGVRSMILKDLRARRVAVRV